MRFLKRKKRTSKKHDPVVVNVTINNPTGNGKEIMERIVEELKRKGRPSPLKDLT